MFYFIVDVTPGGRRMAMTGTGGGPRVGVMADDPRDLVRWECRCQHPPVLLATYDVGGRIHIKVRDRYWHVDGVVSTVCPRCGSEHTLDMRDRGRRTEDEDEGPLAGNILRFPTPDS
jgi:hypothetical protein